MFHQRAYYCLHVLHAARTTFAKNFYWIATAMTKASHIGRGNSVLMSFLRWLQLLTI